MDIIRERRYCIKIVGLRWIFLFCSAAVFLFPSGAHASTNISSSTTQHWAWNDLIGWIDFYNTNSAVVNYAKIAGYASSSAGDISFDCATTRAGDICSRSSYHVLNDGLGHLSGWAWNDEYGWISFDCHNVTSSDCNTSNYEVTIDSATGIFSNYAWNDLLGWISFNSLSNGCGSYCVITSWITTSTSGFLDSTTFDTGAASGSQPQLNSIIWHGSMPGGTAVKFQFATSNASSGPWTFVGSDGTTNSYYNTVAPSSSMILGYSAHPNARYLRYRATLVSDIAQTVSPRIDDVIINWSP